MTKMANKYINWKHADINCLKSVFRLVCNIVDGERGIEGMRCHAQAETGVLVEYQMYQAMEFYAVVAGKTPSQAIIAICRTPRPVIDQRHIDIQREMSRIQQDNMSKKRKFQITIYGKSHGPYRTRYNGELIVGPGW